MSLRVKKRFDLDITGEGETVSKTFELDKNVKSIHGILITSDRDDFIYYRGSQKIEINRQEIFPENYETKLLMSGLNVSPNDRFYTLGGIAPGNGKLTVNYKDNLDARLVFTEYRVSVYLDLELSE